MIMWPFNNKRHNFNVEFCQNRSCRYFGANRWPNNSSWNVCQCREEGWEKEGGSQSGRSDRLAAKIVSVRRQIVGIRDVSTRGPQKYGLVCEERWRDSADEIARKPVKRNPFFREACATEHRAAAMASIRRSIVFRNSIIILFYCYLFTYSSET